MIKRRHVLHLTGYDAIGEDWARFLNRDTNRVATFVLVRQTPGSGRNCLVHGFAGKNHPTLPPPTLKVTIASGP